MSRCKLFPNIRKKKRKQAADVVAMKKKPQQNAIIPWRSTRAALLLLFFISVPLQATSSLHITNEYANGGCLARRKANWTRIRVCNSDDPPEASQLGYCRSDDPFDYMELRIHGQNWESALFETWILQIILSEILNVPTSVETSRPDAKVGFYDFESRLEYGDSDDWESLGVSAKVGDCRLLPKGQYKEHYTPCSHFIPEVWNGEAQTYKQLEQSGQIEPAVGMGTIGEEHWFIPKFTGSKDPTLLSYLGLSGDENRRKLAERFGRPTTWGDYCNEVSLTHCQNDTVAVRAPRYDEVDGSRFFVEGLYQGHFRMTEKNDCDANPTNCTGHIFNYPCTWTSTVVQQTYHLKIALESDATDDSIYRGYTYGQLVDAFRAANATKSDMIIFWWTPEALYQKLVGTDMELTRITMPPVTQECLENRVTGNDTCSPDLEINAGSPLGVCDEPPNALQKVFGGSLYEWTYHPSINQALYSPGYETLKNFQMEGAEIGQLFDYWFENPDNPREAICQWVVDNFDYLRTWVPRSYPRVVVSNPDSMTEPLTLASLLLSSVALIVVFIAALESFRLRDRRVMKYAQLEFLAILLVGLGLVSVGSMLLSLPPTNPSCVATAWMTNLGYTLELVPLIVKGAAITRLLAAAKRLRHVVLSRKQLFGAVIVLSGIVVVFLIVWTAVDPPRKEAEYEISGQVNEQGETMVFSTYFCRSNSNLWDYASVGWQLTMLIVATVQTVQTRSIRREINESQTLAIMIYSHFMFVCLRLVTLFLEKSLSQAAMMHVRSIIYSSDSTATIVIYFLPKFVAAHDESSSKQTEYDGDGDRRRTLESQTVKQLRMLAAVATAQHERRRKDNQESIVTRPGSTMHGSLLNRDLVRMTPALADTVVALGIKPDSFLKSIDIGDITEDKNDEASPPLQEVTATTPSTQTGDQESSGEAQCHGCGDTMKFCLSCGEKFRVQYFPVQ